MSSTLLSNGLIFIMKLIEKLENPCTDEYKKLKEFALGEFMTWNYYQTTHSGRTYPDKDVKDIPLYSHVVMQRPYPTEGIPYSIIKSELFKKVYEVLDQIFTHNNIEAFVIYRINFNSTSFSKGIKKTPWHRDLAIPHTNIIIYLNTFKDGQTYVKDGDVIEESSPKEDDIIIFDGDLDHCHALPKEPDRRVVLVANYL